MGGSIEGGWVDGWMGGGWMKGGCWVGDGDGWMDEKDRWIVDG